jgi:exopolysaccharide production protein ExoQ
LFDVKATATGSAASASLDFSDLRFWCLLAAGFNILIMKKFLLLAEKIFTIVSLLNYLGGPIALLLSGGESEGETVGVSSYAMIQAIFFVNYAIAIGLLVLRWKQVIYVIKRDRFNQILLSVVVLSYFWSALPSVTIVRSIALVGTSLFGLYFATRYSLKEQLQLLAWTFWIAIIFSLIFVIALPKYGVMSGLHAGKWRGMFTHKNALGKSMVLSSLIFLLAALGSQKNKLLWWCGLGCSIFLLLMAKSSSATMTLLIVGLVFLIVRAVRMPYLLMVPTIISLSIVGLFFNLWLTDNATALLGSIGKDATLTGRSELWPAVLDKIWERPWFGYGFSGFWGGGASESAYIWRVTGWDPPNSHNGMLDVWLDLGLFGLLIYLIGFFTSLVGGLAWVRRNKSSDAFWPVMYLLYFWFSNQTESAFLRQNDIYWLLYIVVTFSLLAPKSSIKRVPVPSSIDSQREPLRERSKPQERSIPVQEELVRNVTTALSTLIKTGNRSTKPNQKIPLDKNAAVSNFVKNKKK